MFVSIQPDTVWYLGTVLPFMTDSRGFCDTSCDTLLGACGYYFMYYYGISYGDNNGTTVYILSSMFHVLGIRSILIEFYY